MKSFQALGCQQQDDGDGVMDEVGALEAIIGKQLDEVRAQKEKEALLSALEEKSAVTAVFQPIIDLAKVEIIGYEVFVRGPAESPLYLPEKLFTVAHRHNLADQLEDLCREVALRVAAANNITERIFINIDPCTKVVQHIPKYIKHSLLPELGQTFQNIILEVKQQQVSNPSCCVMEYTLDFFKQGFSIAIDGTGSGFSSLQSITSMRPDYIKIDRLLVHNLNANQYHIKLIAAMVEYAHSVGATVIAQGVETDLELISVMKMGVDYAQGYLFAKPMPIPEKLSATTCELIQECKRKISKKRPVETGWSVSIGEIIEYCPTIQPQDLVKKAERIIASEKAEGIVVVNNAKPVGLLMKNKLYFQLGTRYGVALYQNRPVELVMDKNPLLVDADLPLDAVSHLAMSRANDSKYDFIIVTQNDEYAGIVSITHLLNNVTNLQVRCATNANPLTGLPGNLLVDQKLKSRVEKKVPFAVLYMDLDNFKAFNDKYGFEHGDKALLLTSEILKCCVDQVCRQDVFLGISVGTILS